MAASNEIVDLFFNTGVVFHEVTLSGDLPDIVSGFVLVKKPADGSSGAGDVSVRRTAPGEEPHVEVSALEHIGEFSRRWVPVPYQLSCRHAVQVWMAAERPRSPRIVLAIDTREVAGARGRHLDAALDADRAFRPIDKREFASFLDHPVTRELVRKMETAGIERAPLKLAALLETLAPALPSIRLSRFEGRALTPVSLVVDLGNSRTTGVLAEAHEQGLRTVPLHLRSSCNPLEVCEDPFDSRVTFLPGPFDPTHAPVAVGASFAQPSIVRMGREALDRAHETPHRYACTLSGPKRYLWDGRPVDDRWYFATKSAAHHGERGLVSGRVLKHLAEDGDGRSLRDDGPSSPARPRYAPRAMMLFALVEILQQAYQQINSVSHRALQGRESSPRVLKSLALTFPSVMRREETALYEELAQSAVVLVCDALGIDPAHRPNWVPEPTATNPKAGRFEPFLFVDEALAAQAGYLYEEVTARFAGSMEELVRVFAHGRRSLRVASIDIGGGTSDVAIAEYEDTQPGVGTSLLVQKLFQDGMAIAGDEVCRAILEDLVFPQVLRQLPSPQARGRIAQLFADGGAGRAGAWRTLKAKLVPYFWSPLARCYWALAEGVTPPEHTNQKLYSVAEVMEAFPGAWSTAVLSEADELLGSLVPDFPGLHNLFFRFDRQEIEQTIEGVLREPLRRYADIIAQFDVDIVLLAGRTSALPCVLELFRSELPVAPPRVVTLSGYRVADWYPARWREAGVIKDPKTAVAAGATVLHLASKNRLPGFVLEGLRELEQRPIFGVYRDTEPHLARTSELFRGRPKPGGTLVSQPVAYTPGLTIGFRNVDSPEMEASPLYAVEPADPSVQGALLEDRVSLTFALGPDESLTIAAVTSQRELYQFHPDDFVLSLKTMARERHWLDDGMFANVLRHL
jgi:hypothetical protein